MYIVFDIGGTNIRMALSRDGETIETPVVRETPQEFEDGLACFADMFREVSDGATIIKTAGGVAGVFNRRRQHLYSLPHLPLWDAAGLKARLDDITNTSVFLDNDTAMVGLGEAVSGAGRGFTIVAYLTVSTGVGGARVIDGKLDVGVMNFEPGHQIIDIDGTYCPDCTAFEDGVSLGHFESLVSGASMEKRFGKSPSDIHDQSVWDEEARIIAAGLSNTILHWSPDVVVLGGGMMKSKELSIESIQDHLNSFLTIYPNHPEIIKAELGSFGGLYGALSVLR